MYPASQTINAYRISDVCHVRSDDHLGCQPLKEGGNGQADVSRTAAGVPPHFDLESAREHTLRLAAGSARRLCGG
jgi:hypothetical protein